MWGCLTLICILLKSDFAGCGWLSELSEESLSTASLLSGYKATEQSEPVTNGKTKGGTAFLVLYSFIKLKWLYTISISSLVTFVLWDGQSIYGTGRSVVSNVNIIYVGFYSIFISEYRYDCCWDSENCNKVIDTEILLPKEMPRGTRQVKKLCCMRDYQWTFNISNRILHRIHTTLSRPPGD